MQSNQREPVYEGEPLQLTLDVLVEGEGLRRNAGVRVGGRRLSIDDREVSLEELFWIARRAGMLLLFASEYTLAIQGEPDQLEELARRVEAIVDQHERRRDLLRPIAREVVVATAGAAVSGQLDGAPVKGLFVAVFTQAGVHLFSRRRHRALAWPATARNDGRTAGAGTPDVLAVESADGSSSLRIRYLFPEEITAIVKTAEKAHLEPPADRPIEMFSRGEVAPPTPAELPEFTASVGSLQEASERAAAEIGDTLRTRAGLGPHFFETHFMELGEIALGPLLLRKSAASEAHGLARAVAAMDASGLSQDTKAAVGQATDRLIAVFEQEMKRIGAERRLPAGELKDRQLDGEERRELGSRLQAPFERIGAMFAKLKEQQDALLERLEALEDGPPGAEEERVADAATQWRDTLRRLDRAYESAWRDMSTEIERSWEDGFLPQLAELAAMSSRRREWVQLVLIGVATTIIAAALVFIILL